MDARGARGLEWGVLLRDWITRSLARKPPGTRSLYLLHLEILKQSEQPERT